MLESPAFTPRNVAKYAVKTVVHFQVARITHIQIVEHTSLDDDSKIVDAASHIVGWGVSDALKPRTDQMVDYVADKVAARRAKKQAKKSEKSTTETE